MSGLVELACTNCGDALAVSGGQSTVGCESCGSEFAVQGGAGGPRLDLLESRVDALEAEVSKALTPAFHAEASARAQLERAEEISRLFERAKDVNARRTSVVGEIGMFNKRKKLVALEPLNREFYETREEIERRIADRNSAISTLGDSASLAGSDEVLVGFAQGPKLSMRIQMWKALVETLGVSLKDCGAIEDYGLFVLTHRDKLSALQSVADQTLYKLMIISQ